MADQTANECGICLETLTAAVTLPCSHKFCADCLDGWKSKFGASLYHDINKKEKSKSCPLCRKKIPPSKDMMIQLDYHRTQKREFEARGDTTSKDYMFFVNNIKKLEAEIGDYDGKGLDYDGCIELPKKISDAVLCNDLNIVIDWLGSPVDQKRLSARYTDFMNYTLAHLAVYTTKSDLLSIILQYGADVNALDANGYTPLFIATIDEDGLEQANILLEWGAEMILPRDVVPHSVQKECGVASREIELSANREAFIQTCIMSGNNKMANLISSEFGGRRCEVINLPNHPQLNGKTCVVEKYIAKKEKYKIIFEGSGNPALVGPNNLKRRDRTPLDCGYYITFKNGKISRRDFATKEECQAYVASLDSSSWRCKRTAEELVSLKL